MIYLDNNATTRPADSVVDAMLPFLRESYGNPSSAYSFSSESKIAIRAARERTATLVGAEYPDEVVFTSGGTESDNWAIRGALAANPLRKHVITTAVEHEAVRKLCEELGGSLYEITWLGVDRDGSIDLDELRSALRPETGIVSIMLANNETGVIFPVAEAARIVRECSGALIHTDAVNAAGKIPIDVRALDVDLLSISAHKFHGPKGIGALFIRRGVEIRSSSIGGGQEMGRRAGTEAVHQIAGLGAASELAADLKDISKVGELRNELEKFVTAEIPGTRINGLKSPRLPNTSNISFAGVNGEMLLARLNDEGICVSTGSACNEGVDTVSPVLKAMDVPFKEATGSIRFSFGRFNTLDELNIVKSRLPVIVEDLRRIAGMRP